MTYPSRSYDAATPAERGEDIRPEATEPDVPEAQRHDIETVTVPETADKYPGLEFEKCRQCGKNDRVLNPYERCPEAGE